ncbi:MAG: hypothetical protein HY849_03460 [Nitrosomonadales bacterium]|nr:hypothetical protein [Nitrosomonadales bacterium]
MRWLLRTFFLLFLSLPVVHAVEVIANGSVAERQVTVSTARAMFAMRQTQWADGSPVRVFILPDHHPLHSGLCKEVLSIYPYQLRQSWDRLVYSGTGQAPVEVATEEEMIARVAATPGAIGYIRKVNNNESVRTITVR